MSSGSVPRRPQRGPWDEADRGEGTDVTTTFWARLAPYEASGRPSNRGPHTGESSKSGATAGAGSRSAPLLGSSSIARITRVNPPWRVMRSPCDLTEPDLSAPLATTWS